MVNLAAGPSISETSEPPFSSAILSAENVRSILKAVESLAEVPFQNKTNAEIASSKDGREAIDGEETG